MKLLKYKILSLEITDEDNIARITRFVNDEQQPRYYFDFYNTEGINPSHIKKIIYFDEGKEQFLDFYDFYGNWFRIKSNIKHLIHSLY